MPEVAENDGLPDEAASYRRYVLNREPLKFVEHVELRIVSGVERGLVVWDAGRRKSSGPKKV